MEFMKRLGASMVKKPVVPLAVLLIITAASLGIIAASPPSFDMDQSRFMPDNEMTRASSVVTEAFTSTASVMSMVDSGGDIFTKEAFIDVLNYEKGLAGMEYTDANDPDNKERYDGNIPGFNVLSPVSVISKPLAEMIIAASGGLLPPLPDPSADLVVYYERLIFTIGLSNDAAIKGVASAFLADPEAAMLRSLLTNDFDDAAVSAKGCIVSVMVMDSSLEKIDRGQKGFEYDVIDVANDFNASHPDGTKIRVAGMMTMMSGIGEMAQNDIAMLLPITVVVMILLLLLIYRDAVDTLIGLAGLFVAVIWTFGLATLVGIEITTIAIAVPILVLTLGIDYSLHLVFRYREERKNGNSSSEATEKMMGSVGQALILATVTTAIAFLSYLTSSMSALADFGVMCAIGIVCAFGVMLLLIPAVQILRDRKEGSDEAKRYKRTEKEDVISVIAGAGGKMAARSPWAVLGVVAVIIALFGVSATNLAYNFNMYDFIPEGTEAHDILTYMDDNHSVTTSTTSVLVYDDGWNIDVIKAIQDSLANMSAATEANKIRGLAYKGVGPPGDVVADHIGTAMAEFNTRYGAAVPDIDIPFIGLMSFSEVYDQVFKADGTLKPIIPVVTQGYLDILKAVMSAPALKAAVSSYVGFNEGDPVTRIVLHMTTELEGDNDAIVEMKDRINDACAPIGENGSEYVTTGQFIIMASNAKAMNSSQMTSLFVTILFVVLVLTIFMYYVDRSPLLGIMATIPTLISVIMVWGTMALMNMPLNVMTLTIASLAVGMGVTYGIHISHRFVTELVKNGLNEKEAIIKATRETGKGVFAAALTTVAGFSVMGFSKILPMYQFGIITALAIAFGYMGSVLVLPSLLVIWGKHAKANLTGEIDEKAKRERMAKSVAAIYHAEYDYTSLRLNRKAVSPNRRMRYLRSQK
ncbi:MAG: MMPL family transporter [Methanomassiliicoccaceae archaeon]|nr:MMPL family transporter [Methanomassiliicoccaceae archaeon]